MYVAFEVMVDCFVQSSDSFSELEFCMQLYQTNKNKRKNVSLYQATELKGQIQIIFAR